MSSEAIEREHRIAVEALRSVRDTSISHDDAIHIVIEALRHCNTTPEDNSGEYEHQHDPCTDESGLSFDEEIEAFLGGPQSLGARLQRLAAGQGDITWRILRTDLPQRLMDDLRDPDIHCASCERQEQIDGPAGLCDGCLEALEDDDER